MLDDPEVAGNPIHLSLYTYNDGVAERARDAHPHLSRAARPRPRRSDAPAGGRDLLLPQRRLRPRPRVCWDRSSDSGRLEPVLNGGRPATVRRFTRALRRSLAPIGLVPLDAVCRARSARRRLSLRRVGSDARRRPPSASTDTLGRPSGRAAHPRRRRLVLSVGPRGGDHVHGDGQLPPHRHARPRAPACRDRCHGRQRLRRRADPRRTCAPPAWARSRLCAVRQECDGASRHYALCEPLADETLEASTRSSTRPGTPRPRRGGRCGQRPGKPAAAGRRRRARRASGVHLLAVRVHRRTLAATAPPSYALERAVHRRGGLAMRPGLVFGTGAGGLFGTLIATSSGRR